MRSGGGARARNAARADPALRTIWLGLSAALVLFTVQSAISLVASLRFHSYDSVLDLERNNAIPDLVSTAVIVAAALGAVALALKVRRSRRQATVLAVLLTLAALDDLLQVEAGAAGAWGRTVFPTVVAAALLIGWIALQAPPRPRLTLLAGIFLLAVAVKNAYEYDQLLNLLGRGDEQRGELDYELGIVLKQGLELFGWSLVATGLWAAAVGARGRAAAGSAPARRPAVTRSLGA